MKDKIAFVTGGASGIGRATSIHLANLGCKVFVTDLNAEGGGETVKMIMHNGGIAKFKLLDVSNKNEVDQVIEEIAAQEGQIDFAVNNAGIGGVAAALHEIKEAAWDKMLEINLTGVLFCMQAEIRQFLQNGGGRIVNVSSLAGVNGMPKGASYAAAKHGVIGLSKSAAMEYGSKNIRVNTVSPGFIQTPIIKDVPEPVLQYSTNLRVPMRRIGEASEVASAIAWLLSDGSSYVNGHTLYIDGGFQAS